MALDMAGFNHVRFLLDKMDLRNLAVIAVKMEFFRDDWLKRDSIKKETVDHLCVT